MIASVRGTVLHVGGDSAVVEVGGVGLLVHCTPTTLAGLRHGAEAVLHTSLVVREDALTLYGFSEPDERTVFEVLQTATGVGPKLAQAVLSVHAPDAVRRAVATDDLAALCLVPGVGKKGAQRLVLELKDKLGGAGAHSGVPAARSAAPASALDQVRTGLVGLGYTAREAEDALARADVGPDDDVAAQLRAALSVLRRA